MFKPIIIATTTALALSGAAQAQNLLTNGDAEAGDLSGWTVDNANPAAAADCGFGFATVDGGTYSFSMDQCDTAAGTLDVDKYVSSLSQSVDTTGCNVQTDIGELTGGTYDFSTRYLTAGDDLSTYSLTFRDAGDGLISSSSTTAASLQAFSSGGFSGDIPAGAASAVVSVGGEGVPGFDTNPGSYHDNVSYSFTSCVAAYAVTAGKTTCTGGNDSNGGGDGNGSFVAISDCDGRNGTLNFSVVNGPNTVQFEGAMFVEALIGLMDGTGTGGPETFPYVGEPAPGSFIHFKFKDPKRGGYCHLTPGAGATVTITETDWFINDNLWDHHCEDRHGGVIDAAIWNIPTGAFNGLGGQGRDKDRGTFYLSILDFDLVRGDSQTHEN